MTAGEMLRKQLDEALAYESEQLGEPQQFDVREQARVDAAVRCADAVEMLNARIAAEQVKGAEGNGALIVKLMAERRLQDEKCSAHIEHLQMETLAKLKNPHRVAGGHARWADQHRQLGRRGTG